MCNIFLWVPNLACLNYAYITCYVVVSQYLDILFQVVLFWWYWGLDSGHCACNVPSFHSFFLFPFGFGNFYGHIFSLMEVFFSSVFSLIMSPSKALFISVIGLLVSTISFWSFLRLLIYLLIITHPFLYDVHFSVWTLSILITVI
jgi:hypothetical protein